jgi:rhodanese-related sulfurtransferase
MKRLYTILLILIYSGASAQHRNNSIERLDNMAFEAKRMHVKGTLLDLRSEAELSTGVIEGAVNTPWPGKQFEELTSKLPKNEPIFMYCAGGFRSNEAANWLIKKGFLGIIILEKGFDHWNEEGYALYSQSGELIRKKVTKSTRGSHTYED